MADIVSRIYSNFRGADFRGEEINLVRSPDCLNVWKDYKNTESIRTRPGIELNTSFTDKVYGVFFYAGKMLVHSGSKLYAVENGAVAELFSSLKEAVSNAFIYENIWYFKDGLNYLRYDGEEIRDVIGSDFGSIVRYEYVPTTTIARKPMGGGTKYEDVNMLSDYRKNSFLADGVSSKFYLDTMNIDGGELDATGLPEYYPDVWVDDVRIPDTWYEVDYDEGFIQFIKYVDENDNESIAPPAPKSDGRDNVVVQFKKIARDKEDNPIYHGVIEGCTMLQVFDNRVFFGGNPDYPNMIWNCSLNDPTYVSDLDYYKEGMDTAKVKGLVAGNNALWVFREPNDANTTVFYHTPSLDEEYGKVYPSSHSSITTGCIGKAINFNDDIVFFSERGMEGISGDVTTEQVVAHRSTLVDRKLISEANYKDMVLAEWEGYLLVFIGKKVYLADSRSMFQNENHYEYEWFAWEIEKDVICAAVNDGVLYIGTDDGIYTFTDNTADIESYWVTPLDKFKNPHKMKTTSKKSCTVEAEGEEISVYAKTNKDEDFDLLGTFENVTDAFNCRIKKKKWKDIQLKFYSPKRFALETATLEAYIGGYLKNLK